MQNFRAPGNVVELTAVGPFQSGDINFWGEEKCVVAVHDVAAGQQGSFAVTGVFEFTVRTGSADLNQGDLCYGWLGEPEVTSANTTPLCGRVVSEGPISVGGKVLVRLEDSGL